MKVSATSLTATLILSWVPATWSRGGIVDGSFELATSGTTISNSAWTLVENAPDGLGAQYQDNFAASHGEIGVWFRPFDGSSADPAFAKLTQTITNVAGGDYSLYFDAAREEHFSATSFVATFFSSGGLTASVDLNSALFNLPSNMFDNPTTFDISLLGVNVGDDLTITIEMTGGTQALNNPQSAFVDNFRLTSVPEPGAGVLLAMTMATLGIWHRRAGRSSAKNGP